MLVMTISLLWFSLLLAIEGRNFISYFVVQFVTINFHFGQQHYHHCSLNFKSEQFDGKSKYRHLMANRMICLAFIGL